MKAEKLLKEIELIKTPALCESDNIPVDALVGLPPYYQDDYVTIYNCDSLTAIVALRPSRDNIIMITDPPYGKQFARGKNAIGRVKEVNEKFENLEWDKATPSKEYFDAMFNSSRHQIVFGANYFWENFYSTNGLIIWDKVVDFNNEASPFADCELAWTSFNKVAKIYRLRNQGFVTDVKEEKQHPTQKPEALMIKILEDYTTQADIICDPFMGSGTTLVAAKSLGRKAIGMEINQKYCEIAVKRLSYLQTRLVM